eukprot:Sspe_Gene.15925::Locus_5568_Transcript_1_5_Confidence_0.667_Length_644::g.15925::m.15925
MAASKCTHRCGPRGTANDSWPEVVRAVLRHKSVDSAACARTLSYLLRHQPVETATCFAELSIEAHGSAVAQMLGHDELTKAFQAVGIHRKADIFKGSKGYALVELLISNGSPVPSSAFFPTPKRLTDDDRENIAFCLEEGMIPHNLRMQA